jgi:S-adenosylmethionine:tRNA ribosyltransferase-isomerase
MKLSEYFFDLPQEKIASEPAYNQDQARLMVADRATKTIKHKLFRDIIDEFDEGDVFVVNNAKVFPARLYGRKEKTGAKIEVFLLRELNSDLRLWDVLVDPARKIRVGNKLFFGNDELVSEVIDNTTSRGRTIRFLFDGTHEEFINVVHAIGQTPIPKYLNRDVIPEDREYYQSIFAEIDGAIAPPSAALHFTQATKMRLEIKGIEFATLNLNIGVGSFKPVEVEDITKHKMDSEYFSILEETASRINKAKAEKKKVVAVGSSVVRAMETSISAYGDIKPTEGWTDKYIFYPYEKMIADCLLTNFHGPKTTLLMMTTAYLDDLEFMQEIYSTALKEDYRFLCYGDALLIK